MPRSESLGGKHLLVVVSGRRCSGETVTLETHSGAKGGDRSSDAATADNLATHLGLFLRDANGWRPIYGGTDVFQTDPHWRDYMLFHEYFHGDHGAGLGASHQTGWTALVARLIQQSGGQRL